MTSEWLRALRRLFLFIGARDAAEVEAFLWQRGRVRGLQPQELTYYQYLQRAGAVNALDALQLYVGGGGRAGDEGYCAPGASRVL